MLTCSDRCSAGTAEDRSGPALATLLDGAGFQLVEVRVVPDERAVIADALVELASKAALVVTTGGTGFAPRDVTPEATADVIERSAPGLGEAMRAAGRAVTPMADLSRGIAGAVGSTLIVNTPGSVKGASESLGAILPLLPHALGLLAGDGAEH